MKVREKIIRNLINKLTGKLTYQDKTLIFIGNTNRDEVYEDEIGHRYIVYRLANGYRIDPYAYYEDEGDIGLYDDPDEPQKYPPWQSPGVVFLTEEAERQAEAEWRAKEGTRR